MSTISREIVGISPQKFKVLGRVFATSLDLSAQYKHSNCAEIQISSPNFDEFLEKLRSFPDKNSKFQSFQN